MNESNILEILPNPQGSFFEEIKEKNPYNVMLHYAEAIDKKYNGKLSAEIVLDNILSGTSNSISSTHYAFYINASIGRGYFYKLFEVLVKNDAPYPLKVTIFRNEPEIEHSIKNSDEFNEVLLSIFKSRFTASLLLNLLAQIEIRDKKRYREF